jgi:hypothetical protein
LLDLFAEPFLWAIFSATAKPAGFSFSTNGYAYEFSPRSTSALSPDISRAQAARSAARAL